MVFTIGRHFSLVSRTLVRCLRGNYISEASGTHGWHIQHHTFDRTRLSLCSAKSSKSGETQESVRTHEAKVWWRRRESNPRARKVTTKSLHASFISRSQLQVVDEQATCGAA